MEKIIDILIWLFSQTFLNYCHIYNWLAFPLTNSSHYINISAQNQSLRTSRGQRRRANRGVRGPRGRWNRQLVGGALPAPLARHAKLREGRSARSAVFLIIILITITLIITNSLVGMAILKVILIGMINMIIVNNHYHDIFKYQ